MKEGVLLESSIYIVYIREGFNVSLVCTHKYDIVICEVKVDVQKGALRFRDFLDNRCVSFMYLTFFIHCFRMVLFLNDSFVHYYWGSFFGL